MHSSVPLFLPILNLTFGFHQGDLVELRFDVEHDGGRALMRLRGVEPIRTALSNVGARCDADVRRCYARVRVQGFGNLLEFEPTSLATAEQALAALEAYANDAADAGLDGDGLDAARRMDEIAGTVPIWR